LSLMDSKNDNNLHLLQFFHSFCPGAMQSWGRPQRKWLGSSPAPTGPRLQQESSTLAGPLAPRRGCIGRGWTCQCCELPAGRTCSAGKGRRQTDRCRGSGRQRWSQQSSTPYSPNKSANVNNMHIIATSLSQPAYSIRQKSDAVASR